MPSDTEKIRPVDLSAHEGVIPWTAKTWLLDNNITGYHLFSHYFGWSKLYRRIIMPVYSSSLSHINFQGPKLIGWVGRDPSKLTHEERISYKMPKYLTKKCKMNNRLIYTAGPKTSKSENPGLCVVLVEDIVSAIRIFDASACWGLALLCDSVPRFLLDNIGINRSIILWLDPNMHRKMIQDCIAFRSLGYNIKYVLSKKDPKHYKDHEIRSIVIEAAQSKHGIRTDELRYIDK